MKFRTEIPIPRQLPEIDYQHQLLFIGSCFSEHIANFFIQSQFRAIANPMGILFNPLSIAHSLNLFAHKQTIPDNFLQFFDGKWISFWHHGKFSNPNKATFDEAIAASVTAGQDFLQTTDILFVTLGTAYYYWHKEREMVVANCHKIPAAAFEKRRATVEECVAAFQPFWEWKQCHRPDMKVVFTVSPVRHLSDGFHENQLSKAILHLFIEKMQQTYENVYYFPAYEILLDDLRDYRFYDKDLCHPSAQAIDYVKEIVMDSFFSEATRARVLAAEKAWKRQQHRPLFP